MTPEEALFFILDTNMTKSNYIKMRSEARDRNVDLYPSYDKVLLEKKKLMPDGIIIQETKCEIPLQNLVVNIFNRLLLSLDNIPKECDLIFVFKYGFDGTYASKYKQQYNLIDNQCQEYIFCSSLVPLELKNVKTNTILWTNPYPSSTSTCSPIKIQFIKETAEVCRVEEADIKNQIARLPDIVIGKRKIKFEFSLTMIDGKVRSALNNTSNQKCYLCDSTISQMNDIDILCQKEIKEEAVQYGFSILHAKIRFLEFVLHVAYRLEIKKWKIISKNTDEKKSVEARRLEIINSLRKELGILVDTPKQGHGNTNDGNTARAFFKNVDIVSKITGFDGELLKRFHVILTVISQSKQVDAEKFKIYCLETAKLCTHLYSWYYMPISVHIILLHGYQIIKQFELPIGMLSEEAQECGNKNLKRSRENHARKCSRIEMNQDLFTRLILKADIHFAIKRFAKKKKKIVRLTPEMKSLLINTETLEQDTECSSSNEYENESVGD